MSVSKSLLTLLLVPGLLATSACATGFPAQVSRFQALPAPPGQSFAIHPEDPIKAGLEFSHYANLVRRQLIARGYAEAPSAQAATLIVNLDYGVDGGREKIVSRPRAFSRYGYGPFSYGPYRRQSFYFGWSDPFWYSPFGYGYGDLQSYTVYTSHLEMKIKRTVDGQSVFEGSARARSRTDQLQTLVPNLVEAMFTNFPGRSGEMVRITVPPPSGR